MKIYTAVKRLSPALLLMTVLLSLATWSPAQKQRGTPPCPALDLQCSGAQLDVGKTVFYNPTLEEGCDQTAPQGCKYIARINNIPTVLNEATGRFETVRDAQGRILVDLSIDRADRKGGNFNKDNVPFSPGGGFGTARPIATEDTRGLF
ncbi:MAG TPA: hypothetical protein VF762_18655 [Blastocatellia bacterium]